MEEVNISPTATKGKKLIAHELAHVVQQSGMQGAALQKKDEPRYYSYSTQDYVDQVIEALTETNPVAGVGTPSKAYDILNDIETPQLKEVLLELGKGSHLDVLAPLDSPSHANGMRTQMYIRATRLRLMAEADVTLVEVNEVLDRFGWLPDDQKADIVKWMRGNKKVNEVISAKYAARTSNQTHTELGGLSVGNFDFYYGGCGVQVTIKVKFDFDSSIASKVREPYKKRFFDAVNNTWDNRYQIVSSDPVCSCKVIPIRIKASETTGGDEHKVIDVHNESDYREKVISEINLDLSTTDKTMAHEFGHVLGLYDEYDGGAFENSMFWHDTRYIKDTAAIMNEGSEMRERYFMHYLWAVQKVAAPDCSYSLKVVK